MLLQRRDGHPSKVDESFVGRGQTFEAQNDLFNQMVHDGAAGASAALSALAPRPKIGPSAHGRPEAWPRANRQFQLVLIALSLLFQA
jgi:hypothetical protein